MTSSPARRRRLFAGRHDAVVADVGHPVPTQVKILVTVGTELPFDRLVGAIDDWAGQRDRSDEVFAQVGHTTRPPRHIGWTRLIDAPDFRRLFASAELIVAHAGMGTIIAALEQARPLIVVPRHAELGEHRNDHQLATVARLADLGLIDAASDEIELTARLDLTDRVHQPVAAIPATADPELLAAVRAGIAPTTLRERSAARAGALVAKPGRIVARPDRSSGRDPTDEAHREEHRESERQGGPSTDHGREGAW